MFRRIETDKGSVNALTSSENNFYMALHMTHAIFESKLPFGKEKKIGFACVAVTTHSDAAEHIHSSTDANVLKSGANE